jgi:hypothetical protein
MSYEPTTNVKFEDDDLTEKVVKVEKKKKVTKKSRKE